MDHIISRHMRPVKFGKSYFISRQVSVVSNMISQTLAKPDEMMPHVNDSGKTVFKKQFLFQTGVHGVKRQPCYSITAIVNNTSNRVITAFPSLR